MQGRTCDAGVLPYSALYNTLTSGVLKVPQTVVLPGNDRPVPYVLVADDGFPLNSYLIKAYAGEVTKGSPKRVFNPLNAELNPICRLLALLGVHHFLHVSRIRVKSLTLRLLMSYIYIYIYMTLVA